MQENYLDVAWRERSDQIRKYYELHSLNERLCSTIASNLKLFLKNENLEYAQISYRAKTLDSFCEKMYRKNYQDPILEITDLAGVRIVFLYESDIDLIEKIIRNNFEIVEVVDKALDQGAEVFGYRALHYIVREKSEQFESKFYDLKGLVCEIQVRTSLQDAWALVAHHLSYKQESDVPKELRRKLNALSGLFETADNQLESIRNARQKYQAKLDFKVLRSDSSFLRAEINLDNLIAYTTWRFPDRPGSSQSAADLLDELHQLNYKTLVQLDKIVDRTFDAVAAYEKAHPPSSEDDEPTIFTCIGLIRSGLAMIHNDFYRETHSARLVEEKLAFIHLIKP